MGYVAHTDSRFDPELLRRFVSAYQRLQPFTIGELWAVAITLRVVWWKISAGLAEIVASSRSGSGGGGRLADRLLGTGGREPIAPAAALRQFENKASGQSIRGATCPASARYGSEGRPILIWLDERLDAQHTTADEIVRAEHQDQTAMTVTVRNIITSMRLMSDFDWKEFFESVSLVDEVLRMKAILPKWILLPGIITAMRSRIFPAARHTRKWKSPAVRSKARSSHPQKPGMS